MSAINLLVFRDTRYEVAVATLAERAKAWIADSNGYSVLDALITAGQMESALADCASPDVALAERVTDQLAAASVASTPLDTYSALQNLCLLGAVRQRNVRVSDPEGFSYYALHPLDFQDVFRAFKNLPYAAVIGIRSIGTTLSAVARAALRQQGTEAERITVRPVGHPYSRTIQFTAEQKLWVERRQDLGATFFVVDEGPGLSGSSFLSVAESLIHTGVPRPSIRLIGTHQFDPAQLCATNSAERWERFIFHCVPSRISAKFSGLIPLGGGNWRRVVLGPQNEWPASWTAMESTKYLSESRDSIFKFDGFGHFGDRVRARARLLYEGGFSPQHSNIGEGISKYHFVAGVPLRRADLSTDVLDRIGGYCSFRADAFRANDVTSTQLQQMTEFNFFQDAGENLDRSFLDLEPEIPVISDNRMHPHEWIRSKTGHLFKVDASQHGDDHFFPGPTDVAWDLAGAIVEWDMDSASASYLLERFRQLSGYDVSRRIGSYLLAYSAFRMAYCKMASDSIADGSERTRLQRTHEYYRARMQSAAKNARRQLV